MRKSAENRETANPTGDLLPEDTSNTQCRHHHHDDNETNDFEESSPLREQQQVWYRRPRILYGVIFVWLAISGGRFVTPFLEHECRSTAAEIAGLFAVQQLVGIPANSWAGRFADAMEVRHPGTGRAMTVAVGTSLGTFVYLMHGMSRLVLDDNEGYSASWTLTFSWFAWLRVFYAVAVSLVCPVIDGMCLQFLREKQQDYGKERLWGAITWALTNAALGPLLDRWGFSISYPLTIASYLVVLCTLYLYVSPTRAHNGRGPFYTAIQKRNSEVQLTAITTRDDNLRLKCRNEIFPAHTYEDDEQNIHVDDSRDECLATEATVKNLRCHPLPVDQVKSNESVHNKGLHLETRIPTSELIQRLLFGSPAWYFGCCFVLAITILSAGQIIVDSLIFLFFEDLGSSYTIMGLTIVLTVSFEIPVFSVADQLLERLGSMALLLIAMGCYIVRVLGYTLIPNGHVGYALLVEPMHGITYACSQTAVVAFAAQSMPVGYEATGQGYVYVMRGLGSVVGLLLGALAEGTVGPRILYRSAAAVVSSGCLILVTASACQLKQQQRGQLRRVCTDESNNDGVPTVDPKFSDERNG